MASPFAHAAPAPGPARVAQLAWVGFAPNEAAGGQATGDGSYVVQPGDTLFAIARRTSTAVSDLVTVNGIADPDRLVVGQRVQLPAASAVFRSYVVQAGDTLWQIARANGVPIERLIAVNELRDPNQIRAGHVLQIPQAPGASAALLTGGSAGSAAPYPPRFGPMPGVRWLGVPSYSPGRPAGEPIALVLHIADGSLAGLDTWFVDPANLVSAHFGIGLDGTIHQYVDLADQAWTNGYLEPGHTWPGPAGVNPNALSVTIEIEDRQNPGYRVSEAQYQTALRVGRYARTRFPGLRYLVTHRAIAPLTRSDDPGPAWLASGRFSALARELGLTAIP